VTCWADAPVVTHVPQHGHRPVHRSPRVTLGDRVRQHRPRVDDPRPSRRGLRQLEHRQRRVLAQPQTCADHRVGVRCVPRSPPAPECPPRHLVRVKTAQPHVAPQPVRPRRQPLHLAPWAPVRSLGRHLPPGALVSPAAPRRPRRSSALANGIGSYEVLLDRPQVELVDRGDFPVPAGVFHSGPGVVAPPPPHHSYAARSSMVASRQSQRPRRNHRKSKYVRRSRACAA
jgi:hypothetical protein